MCFRFHTLEEDIKISERERERERILEILKVRYNTRYHSIVQSNIVEILASRYYIFRDTRSEKRVLRSSFDREREREREKIIENLKVR